MYRLNLKENALDSLDEALAKYQLAESGAQREYKYAVLNLAHFMEIILKLYVQSIDEQLVFSKCYRAVAKRAKADKSDLQLAHKALVSEGFDFKKLVNGDPSPNTIRVDQAIALAQCEICQHTGNQFIRDEFVSDVDWMRNLRNQIEHFEFQLTPKDVRLAMGRLIRGAADFVDVMCLFDLEEEIGRDTAEIFNMLADEYQHFMREAGIEVEEKKEEAFRGVRPKHQQFIEWNEYQCYDCTGSNNFMIPNAESETGYRCTLCGNEQSGEIEIFCDICGGPWANEEMYYWADTDTTVCPRCEHPELY